MRNPELIWNRSRRGFAVLNTVELLDQFLTVFRHLVKQRFGEEARRLADAKLDRRAAALFQKLQQALILFRRVVRVKLLSKGGNHSLLQHCHPVRSGCFAWRSGLRSRSTPCTRHGGGNLASER